MNKINKFNNHHDAKPDLSGYIAINHEINLTGYALFHITAMMLIWRFFNGLTTIKETLIFQGTLLEFLINIFKKIKLSGTFLPLFIITVLFISCGSGECGTVTVTGTGAADIKTVVRPGSSAIVNGNTAFAKDQAIKNAISISVGEVVSSMLTRSDLTENLGTIYENVLNNPQKYIVTYRLLNELEKNNHYIVAVESKIDSAALNDFFTEQGILNKKNQIPKVLLLISEQSPGEILPRYWWGKNPLPYKSITENAVAAYISNSHICEIAGTGDQRPDPENFGITFDSIHDPNAAIKLGREIKADIVVIGSAAAKQTLNTMGDEKSFKADVTLKAFRTDTGDMIASIETNAAAQNTVSETGIEEGFQRAGTLAGEKLVSAIDQHLNEQNNGPRLIEIKIKGTDYLSSFIMLKRIMNKMDGIQDIQTKELESDQAVADIKFLGSAKKLANALMLQTFESFGIEISDVKDASLTIKFVPVNKAKPVSKSDIEAAHISE